MGCLGVHFAITSEEAEHLKSLEDDDIVEYLQEELEEHYFSESPEFKAETDKSWDALHRLLSDGELSYTSGPMPLRLAVIGGQPMYFGDDYIMSLKTPDEVKEVASALSAITKEEFRTRYNSIDEDDYGFPLSEEDFDYTWGWFGGVVEMYQKAAEAGRYVLFTADQ